MITSRNCFTPDRRFCRRPLHLLTGAIFAILAAQQSMRATITFNYGVLASNVLGMNGNANADQFTLTNDTTKYYFSSDSNFTFGNDATLDASSVSAPPKQSIVGVPASNNIGFDKTVLLAFNPGSGSDFWLDCNINAVLLSGGGKISSYPFGTGDYTITITGLSASANYAGKIINGGLGSLALTMNQAGATQILSGINAYTGPTKVLNGNLTINGSLNSASPVTVSGGRLKGTGTVGRVTLTGGAIEPGDPTGTLVTGNLSLTAPAAFGCQLKSSSLSGKAQVTGTVSLGGASLTATYIQGYVPTAGTKFIIIANDGTDAISGTFAGLPQGATARLGSNSFTISYVGGDGNDVELTALGSGFTVTYNGNSNTGGTAPTDGSSPYASGATVTVLTNSGNLTRTDYTFAGWNTAANGSGTDYAASGSATFSMGSANVTLYAKWTANTYTVTYDGNGNTGGTAPTDGSSPYTSGTTVIVLSNSGSLTRTGYTFAGWNTAANGSGSDYAANGSATFPMSTANVTLYAKWTANTYTVAYNGNGNTGGTAPTDGSSPYTSGTTVTVLSNSGSLTRSGYSFAGWNTAANGSGTDYAASGSATFPMGTANVTLYAKWTVNTYTVAYNGNGNTSGTAPTDGSSPYNSGSTVTVLGNTGTLVKSGYNFAGWNSAANGSGTSYSPGNTFALNANTTLYAQWTLITYTVSYHGNGSTGGTVPTDASSPYSSGATVTVLGNTGTLTQAGFTFAGWNTAANGSGTAYNPAGTFAINANTTLYAQWTANTPTINSVSVPNAGTYRKDDVLTFTASMSLAVTVTGAPRLPINIGGSNVYATYDAASSTSTALKFKYTVQLGDSSAGGVIVYDYLELNGGTINATLGSTAANLGFTAPSGSTVVVDGAKPAIVAHPGSRSIGIGGTSKTTLTVAASGNGLTYQWRKGGTNVSGATSTTYTISSVKVADAGDYDCVVSNANGSTTSNTGTLTILPNPIVYSGNINVGASGATAYFAIEGSSNKKLILAAYGPATNTGGAISDPQISVVDSAGTTVATNDNWGSISDANFSTDYNRLSLTTLNSGSKDAVVYGTFAPGTYTITVSGVSGATGSALLAIADADLNPPSRLAYVAFRGPVANGSPLKGGFRISNTATKKLLLRAVGPSLASGGIADPILTAYDSDGTTAVGSNNNWAGDSALKAAFVQAGAFSLASDSSLDAALLANQSIGTGSYTAQVTTSSGTGDALFEIYDLDGTNNSTFAPATVSPPAAVTASTGPVSFTVGAAGGGTLSYVWKRGGTTITGATSATLTLNNITTADAGTYTVTVTNSSGSASASTTLKVVPAITSASTASGTYGSNTFSYTVTGSNSPTSYGATGLPAGLSINTTTGQITGTPTASVAGSPYSATISATNADGTGTATLAITINKRTLLVAGITASPKTYDGTTTAVINTSAPGITGVFGTDDVGVSFTSAVGNFVSKDVGSRAVAITGAALTGTTAGNYTLSVLNTAAVAISAKELTVTGITASPKAYDGSPTATVNTANAALVGVITGETVPLSTGSATGTFDSKNVGTGRTVTVAGLSIGSTGAAANYSLTQPTTTASITAKVLTVTGVTASPKTYDSTTTATLNTASAALVGVLSGESVTLSTGAATGTFDTRNVGTGKTVTVAGLSIGSTGDAANYSLTQPTTTANITAKGLTVSGITASERVYDGTVTAPISTAGAALVGVVSGDSVSLVTSGANGLFATKSVGTDKAITVSGLTLAPGGDSGNYTLAQPTGLTAKVTAKPLTISGVTASNKVYDGSTGASLSGTPAFQTAQAVGTGATNDGKPYLGDDVSITGTMTGAFADRHVANNKTVTVSGLTLTGTEASNYSVAALTATAHITPKALTVSGITASPRVYDATTIAPLGGTPALATAEIVGAGSTTDGIPYDVDTVSVGGTPAGAFADRHVANAKAITVTGITLGGTHAANYTPTQPTGLTANVTAKTIAVSGLNATSRIYDATTTVALTGTPALQTAQAPGTGATSDNSPYTGDDVSISGTAAGAFADRHVANAKAITVSGLSLAGAQATNYTIAPPTTLTANVTAKALTSSGVTGVARVYDGTTVAPLNGTVVLATAQAPGAGTTADGVPYTGDTVSLSGTAVGAFADRHVGTAKAITVSGLALAGAQAGNYTLVTPSGVAATISPKALTITGVTGVNRVYDATIAATLSGTAALLAAQAPGAGTTADGKPYTGDTVAISGAAVATFATKGTGAVKPLTVIGYTLAGAQAGNYSATQPTSLRADITPRELAISGVTVANKTFDGTTQASVNTGSAALVGVMTGDSVALVATGVTGTFASTSAGVAKPVTIAGFTISGGDAANYFLTQPSATATISPAAVTFVLGNLNQTYDGAPKRASVGTSLSDGSYTVTYGGATSAPTNAGSYAVAVNVVDPSYVGSASGTLVIAKATQTVTVSIGSGTTTRAITTSASSGLPVTLSVVSGPGSITGTALTLTGNGPVVVRASQAGNDNYLAASAEAGVTATVTKLNQTITFGALSNHVADEKPFAINATASSGLPVTFTVAGPAIVSGSALTLTGALGAVTVTASQPGNDLYNPAPNVSQSFNVVAAGHKVYFGLTQNNDSIAIDLAPDGKSGTLLLYIGATGEAFIVNFTVNADGTFDAEVTSLSSSLHVDLVGEGNRTPPVSAAPVTRVFRGSVSGGSISGAISGLGSFSTTIQPAAGPTAPISGLYQSSAINSASGTTASIVGTQGQVLVVAATATITTGGTGLVNNDGTFSVKSAAATINGNVDAPTTTVSGTIVVPGQTPVNFSGLASTTIRTDRLINLSSRVRVAPSGNATLITGFVIGGTQPKRVLLRAIGPALAGFGVAGALSNPRLDLYDGTGKLMVSNEDWSGADTATAFAQVGAFALTAGSRDSALLTTLPPGAYTMLVNDGGENGVALAEIYDASANPQGEYQRLINISSRGTVGAGEGALIGGFVITGNSPKKVLVRGIGPSLAAFGLTGTLADPRLAIYSGVNIVAQNNDWGTAQAVGATQVVATAADLIAAAQTTGAFALSTNSKDAALIVTLAPGAYTAQVTAADGTATGVALVEIYEIP